MTTRTLSCIPIAWPTLALAVAVVVTWVTATVASLLGWIPLGLGAVINAIAALAAFTPMHDASHRSVARARWVNELVGRVCAPILLAPFPAFRYVHLEHHKHTNDEARDPDLWSGRGPWWLLPLRWLSQDLHYYVWYAGVLRKRPRSERIEVAVTFVAIYAALAAACVAGHGAAVLVLWLVPTRIAIGLLAFGFDYLPHRPHDVPSSVDRYRATAIVPHRWLTPVLLYQNYHLIHHLYPGVPFYRYSRVWRERERELIARGAKVVRLYGGDARLRPGAADASR